MTIFLLGLIIPLLSYFLQAYPRFFNKYFGVDVWSRMIEADYIRKNNHRVPMKKISDGFILEGFYNYPPVFPWILSFFSKKLILKYQGFIAPLFDVMQNYLIFLITHSLTGNWQISFMAQAIYATIPLIIIENSYLTPRSLGYLNFTLAFYPLLAYSFHPNIYYLVISFVFILISFFTHKFATQSIFFACVFFSIYDNNARLYILVFILSALAAVVISRGYYFRVLQGHIDNIRFWMKNFEYRFAHQVRGILKNRKNTDFIGQMYYLLNKFSPITLIATNLWLIFPIWFFFDRTFGIYFIPDITNPLIYKMAVLVIFFYILSVLVLSIKYLIPIGEGQRYLEMVTAPTAIISSIIIYQFLGTQFRNITFLIFIFLILINLLIALILQFKAVIKDRSRSLTYDMEQVFKFLNKMRPKPRILCIPHQITTLILFNTNTFVLVDIQAGTLDKIQDVYPILKSSVKEIAKKYNLNTLVLRKDYTTMEELKLTKRDLLFESSDTQIFKID